MKNEISFSVKKESWELGHNLKKILRDGKNLFRFLKDAPECGTFCCFRQKKNRASESEFENEFERE